MGECRRRLSLGSGRPYTLRTGRDDFHTGQTNARPAGVGAQHAAGAGIGECSTSGGRTSLRSGPPRPAKRDEDAPAFSIGIDAFNVLNRVNYSGFVGTLTSPFYRPGDCRPAAASGSTLGGISFLTMGSAALPPSRVAQPFRRPARRQDDLRRPSPDKGGKKVAVDVDADGKPIKP